MQEGGETIIIFDRVVCRSVTFLNSLSIHVDRLFSSNQ